MIPAKNQPDRIYHYLKGECVQVGAPVHQAMAMAREGIDRLSSLALAGDTEAIRLLHHVACVSVEMINTNHFEHAHKALEWPIVLPQDRDARLKIVDQGKRMRIGSVKAGGVGAPDKLGYNSDKGFAIQNLRRINEARKLLKSSGYDGYEHETIAENGWFTGWHADAEFMEVIFHGRTEIQTRELAFLLKIRDLPDYGQQTKSEWIDLMEIMLKKNPHLVTERYIDMECKIHKTKYDNKIFIETEWRGHVVRQALKAGLKHVQEVPGVWGD